MRKKEREDLKNEIAYRNMMTKKLGRSMKMFFFIFLLFNLFYCQHPVKKMLSLIIREQPYA